MKSNRVNLVNCDRALLKIILKGDEYLSKELGINVPTIWSEFGKGVFEYTLKMVEENPLQAKWFSYLPIEKNKNILLGSCGYKGAPDKEGMVEIGYEVAKDFRNQGYATEIAELLIEQAFQCEEVKKIQAHTLAEKNASVSVLEKCQFKFIEEIIDEEDGVIWKWMRGK